MMSKTVNRSFNPFGKSKLESLIDKIINFFIEEERDDRVLVGLKIVIRLMSFFLIYYLYTSNLLPFAIASNVSSYVEAVFTVLFIFDFLALLIKESEILSYIRGLWKIILSFPIVTIPILTIMIYALNFKVEGFGYIDPALLFFLGTVFLFDGAFSLFYAIKKQQGAPKIILNLFVLVQGIIIMDLALFYIKPIPLYDYYNSLQAYFHYVLNL